MSGKVVALRSRDPFGAVLDALRAQIRRGEPPPGEPLIVMDLADGFSLSATPVREALAHLAGEGLIIGRRGKGRGYATWAPSAADLSDLYRLHLAHIQLALARGRARTWEDVWGGGLETIGRSPRDPSDIAMATEGLFDAMVARAGSPVLSRAYRTVADRLFIARLAEPAVFKGLEAELQALMGEPWATPGLAQAVRAYHRRRLADVDDLVSAMRRRV